MEYLIHIGILSTIYAILALSLNLIVGEAGLLSITQAAFYGVGAYATALLMVNSGMNFFLATLIGIILSGLLALFIGFVLSKFKGDYYAIGSFGFNIIVFSIFLNWQSVTRGPLGIPGIARPEIFGFTLSENINFLFLAIISLVVIYFISKFITESSFGRVLRTIREDEEVAKVFGYDTKYFKLTIFVISAMIASFAGSLYASYISFIDPSSFNLNESIFILAIIILGGLASNKGAMLGALFLIVMPEALRFVGFPSDVAAQMRQVAYGLILILFMLYRPQGFLGKYRV